MVLCHALALCVLAGLPRGLLSFPLRPNALAQRVRPVSVASSSTSQFPVPPHSGYHGEGVDRGRFFEGWFLRVTVEERSYSFIYHIMDPNECDVSPRSIISTRQRHILTITTSDPRAQGTAAAPRSSLHLAGSSNQTPSTRSNHSQQLRTISLFSRYSLEVTATSISSSRRRATGESSRCVFGPRGS